jgi:tetratricopeptide (TPR) repeat protein
MTDVSPDSTLQPDHPPSYSLVKEGKESASLSKARKFLAIALVVAVAGLGVAAVVFRHRLPILRGSTSPTAAARTAYANKDWQRALDLARGVLKTSPDDREALKVYARASARLGNDAAATKVFNQRLGGSEIEPEDYFLSGLMLSRAGQLDMALDVWRNGAETRPECPEMLEHLVELAVRLHRADPALDAARRLAKQPGWEARGLLLTGQLEAMVENPRAAVEAIQQGLKLDPAARGAPWPADHYRKILARCLLLLGRAKEAQAPLQEVVGVRGHQGADPEAAWLLSRAYLQEGQIELAAAAPPEAKAYRASIPLEFEPCPYVGAAKCEQCHSEISKSHVRSRHARTFHRGADLLALTLPERPLTEPDDPKVTHFFVHEKDRVVEETRTPDKVHKLVINYAFGTRGRYVTMVGRDEDGLYRVARMSHLQNAEGSGWIPSFGNEPSIALAERVRGETIDVRDGVVRCVYCHVTRSGNFRDPPLEFGIGPEAADAAIGCERCHGPGSNHIAAVKAGFTDAAIVTVPRSDAAAVTRQCGDCHTVDPPDEIAESPEHPRYIRSPAVTLTFSRCYKESQGKLSCLTCHNAHRDDDHVVARQEANCLSCHSEARSPANVVASSSAPKPEGRGSVCKVNRKNDCLKCHMPKIFAPAVRALLTDHFIRVRKEKS